MRERLRGKGRVFLLLGMLLVAMTMMTGCTREWRRTQAERDAANNARIAQMEAEYQLQVTLMEMDNRATITRLDAEAQLYYDQLNAQRILITAEAEGQANIARAQAAAEVQRIHAVVTAEYIVISAQAQAEANRLIAASLEEAILQFEWIQSWDGRLPSTLVAGGNVGDAVAPVIPVIPIE